MLYFAGVFALREKRVLGTFEGRANSEREDGLRCESLIPTGTRAQTVTVRCESLIPTGVLKQMLATSARGSESSGNVFVAVQICL